MEILQGEVGYEISLKSIENIKSFAINSPGGSLFDGLAMYDYIKGSDIEVGVIGLAASAATLPLIASSKSWGTPNSRYLIHNPWNMAVGEASEIEKVAEDLKAEQQRAVNLYFEHLNGTKEELQALMNEEKILSAKEALELGLIKEIRNFNTEQKNIEGSEIKQLFTNFKMQIEMNESEKKEMTGIKTGIDKLVSMFSKAFQSPKLVIVQDVNGIEINFTDVETADNVAIGDKATIDGSPASGENVLPSGETYVFEGGELAEIKEAEQDEAETLKTENSELKIEIESLKTGIENSAKESTELKANLETQINDVKSKFESFKSQFSTEKAEDNKPAQGEETRTLTFKINK